MDAIHFLVVLCHLFSQFILVDCHCSGERSQRGFALLNSSYSSQSTNGYSDCLDLCFYDFSCISFNFWWDNSKCDLNNQSRETCPDCYVNEPSSTYMGMARNPEAVTKTTSSPSTNPFSATLPVTVTQAPTPSTTPESCSSLKRSNSSAKSGSYVIDPDGSGGEPQFTVYCDMTGVGVTVISHDSESRTLVDGYDNRGSYTRDIHYTGASLSQLASLTRVSSHCKQFIKYECIGSVMLGRGGYAWWVSRDSTKMTYWGGASPGSGKCACGMTNSCVETSDGCNCDKDDDVWRADSGLLTDKSHLPVKQLRFGDTGDSKEKGYHTLGKLKCSGIN